MPVWREEDPILKDADESLLPEDLPSVIQKKRGEFLESHNRDSILTQIAECAARIKACTQRYQYHDKVDATTRLEELQVLLKSVESGEALKKWEARVNMYMNAYKQVTGDVGKKKRKATSPPQAEDGGVEATFKRCRKDAAAGSIKRYDKVSLRDEFVALNFSRSLASSCNSKSALLIDDLDVCDRCTVPMVVLGSVALRGCKTCGRTRLYVQATSFTRAYKEDGREFSGFNYKYSYKRSHHMQDWIHLVQGKETAEVHADVITHVMQEFVLRRITSKDAIDAKKVREVLKSLKLRKYYDNVAQITARITGKPPPRMTLDQESQCLLMFHAVEQLWPIHCPADRRNFLSYSYCLYKFCELLGWDYLLPNFSLLKGKDKLQRQDAIWKKICDDLEWDYFPSI